MTRTAMSRPEDQLLDFLNEHGVVREFIENLAEYSRVSDGSTYIDHYTDAGNIRAVQERHDEHSIDGAFTWSGTPQGHGFWEELHYDFIELFGKVEQDYNIKLDF